jgi:hypothetical protein
MLGSGGGGSLLPNMEQPASANASTTMTAPPRSMSRLCNVWLSVACLPRAVPTPAMLIEAAVSRNPANDPDFP